MVEPFNDLGMHLGNLSWLSQAQTRSIGAENPTGAKGAGGSATEGTGALVGRRTPGVRTVPHPCTGAAL